MNRLAHARQDPVQSTLQDLVQRYRMNDPVGDIAHHFMLANTVKTIYVNRRQHRGLVAGALGIVVLDKRHHLIPSPIARQILALEPCVPVIIAERNAVNDGVPDDLIW